MGEEKIKKSKSALQKRFEEKKAQNTDPQKNDKDILKEVLDETNKKEKEANLKNLKQIWKPAHKPFFDKECRDANEKLMEQAVQLGYDLDSKVGDFKKFKNKNKESCMNYFQLLESKRTAFNTKQKSKQEAKSGVNTKPEIVDSNANEASVNEDKVLKDNKTAIVKVETEADVDETIGKVERELKKERRKQAKQAKKLKESMQEGIEDKLLNAENKGNLTPTTTEKLADHDVEEVKQKKSKKRKSQEPVTKQELTVSTIKKKKEKKGSTM